MEVSECRLTSRRSQRLLALSVRFRGRRFPVRRGSAFIVRRIRAVELFLGILPEAVFAEQLAVWFVGRVEVAAWCADFLDATLAASAQLVATVRAP